MSEHTKGPWTAVVLEEGNIVTGQTRHCGNVCELDRGTESEANARLIAAAPELLAALERLSEAVNDYAAYHGPSEDHHPDDCPDDDCQGCAMDLSVGMAISAAQVAIAKARGTP